ncbi:MAG TPA: hypothetical protein VN325_12595 [Steroidobacteraceae bacterium]|nr:hypothetical protein [Steroidobacteraceae bacterium]
MRENFERVGDVSHLIVDAGRAVMHASIDRILVYEPAAAYLTHYTVGLQA